MSVSGVYEVLPPEVSGALRYERIARFEAILALKEKQRRSRVLRWSAAVVALSAVVTLIVSL